MLLWLWIMIIAAVIGMIISMCRETLESWIWFCLFLSILAGGRMINLSTYMVIEELQKIQQLQTTSQPS